ncbi:MAG: hypothetical protein RJA87_1067 [Pseudomonadota bacterium]|jgi:hypothetical protein
MAPLHWRNIEIIAQSAPNGTERIDCEFPHDPKAPARS